MKYIGEFRDKTLVKTLVQRIHRQATKPCTFMEVCGGHTMAIQRFGIPYLLPENIRLVSGPGCPVCVTHQQFIDTLIIYSQQEKNMIATFGDLMRVPGSNSSLMNEKATGADIRVIFSPFDALKLAAENSHKNVIFPGIGFETTAPGTAVAIMEAQKEGLNNFFVLSSHKIMPPAMSALIDEGVHIDGYIAPGHVSVITGSSIYNFIASQFHIPVVVSGFEPTDMLQSISMLLEQVNTGNPRVAIQYSRAVTAKGNKKAQSILNSVFETNDDWWRGLGVIANSGLQPKPAFRAFDAAHAIPVKVPQSKEPRGCLCGEILKGVKKPDECGLFAKACTPENPVGACMVSNEGACQAYFKYRDIA